MSWWLPDVGEFVQQTIARAHSKGDHTTVGTPIAPEPTGGKAFVPTERVMVGARCHRRDRDCAGWLCQGVHYKVDASARESDVT